MNFMHVLQNEDIFWTHPQKPEENICSLLNRWWYRMYFLLALKQARFDGCAKIFRASFCRVISTDEKLLKRGLQAFILPSKRCKSWQKFQERDGFPCVLAQTGNYSSFLCFHLGPKYILYALHNGLNLFLNLHWIFLCGCIFTRYSFIFKNVY